MAGLCESGNEPSGSLKAIIRLPWLVLLAQSLKFTVSRTQDLQRQSTELRTQVPNCGPCTRTQDFGDSPLDAHTAADTLKSNSGLEAGFTATHCLLSKN
ncbi:hypothetical protein ANN_03726 [Periplaneta americana]|uniref:Uncharacterized protein n=1 Tax=Periplaneta americana TaxID=6978 RepID=A0ABQ8U2Y6_PERAM|nr:hypothetical protein ANN_03726 [Periplaneta americana]